MSILNQPEEDNLFNDSEWNKLRSSVLRQYIES